MGAEAPNWKLAAWGAAGAAMGPPKANAGAAGGAAPKGDAEGWAKSRRGAAGVGTPALKEKAGAAGWLAAGWDAPKEKPPPTGAGAGVAPKENGVLWAGCGASTANVEPPSWDVPNLKPPLDAFGLASPNEPWPASGWVAGAAVPADGNPNDAGGGDVAREAVPNVKVPGEVSVFCPNTNLGVEGAAPGASPGAAWAPAFPNEKAGAGLGAAALAATAPAFPKEKVDAGLGVAALNAKPSLFATDVAPNKKPPTGFGGSPPSEVFGGAPKENPPTEAGAADVAVVLVSATVVLPCGAALSVGLEGIPKEKVAAVGEFLASLSKEKPTF